MASPGEEVSVFTYLYLIAGAPALDEAKGLINKNHNKIIYYCTNHFLNTMKKKLQFKKNPCKGRVEFLRNEKNFYFSHLHNSICDSTNRPIYDNLADVTNNVYNFTEYKQKLLEYLNLHPLITYEKFKLYASKLFLANDFDFIVRKNTFANIFYPRRRTAKIFNWYSIFDNNKTIDGNMYLKDVSNSYIYMSNGKEMFWHKHIIWCSDFFINRMKTTKHLYIDGTFITTKDFKQLIIIMFFDDSSKRKIPGSYILLNNKNESGYLKALSEFRRLITIENTEKLNLTSISTDFENGIINAIKLVFPEIRHVGCLFHYVQALYRNMKSLKLTNKNFDHKGLLKDLSSLPFKFGKDKYIFDSIFDKYKILYEENIDISNNLNAFRKYFNSFWLEFFYNGSLNYSKLDKNFRSNSYIENYNKRIKDQLCKFIYY